MALLSHAQRTLSPVQYRHHPRRRRILEFRLTLPKKLSWSDFDKVRVMKSFLDVLEIGIIKVDVGLSGVDPRPLARGEEREAVFVGELLRWPGQKSGILPLVFKGGTVTRPWGWTGWLRRKTMKTMEAVGRRGRRER
jgi:hypothetical protein